MTPGRELDALVAEKVMGWLVDHRRMLGAPKPHITDPFVDHIELVPVPRFSTDIAAAWEVVDTILTPTAAWGGHRYFKVNAIQEMFTVTFETNYEGRATAKTMPHAICLAALKAVGADIIKK
jgi:hypothetical protein